MRPVDYYWVLQPAQEKVARPLQDDPIESAAAKDAAFAELAKLMTRQAAARQNDSLPFLRRRLGLLVAFLALGFLALLLSLLCYLCFLLFNFLLFRFHR